MSMILLAPMALALFGGHAVADYGQQSAYVAEFKVPRPGNPDWFVTLAAHCLIHSFVVLGIVFWAVLGGRLLGGDAIATAVERASVAATILGVAELILHFEIDRAKGLQRFSYRADQAMHYGCKIAWVAVVAAVLAH